MFKFKTLSALILTAFLTINLFAADIILNEYNAVDDDQYLGGGTSLADEDGGRACDEYFNRIPGNGGDWFELVVITDHLDIRNWQLDIYEDGLLDETLNFTNHAIWSDLRSGTIITVSENVPSDISYDPAAGDWWINVQAADNADGLYIEASNFPVSSSLWQLKIKNQLGLTVFGPAGEGVSPASGIGGTEIFRLEAVPKSTTIAASPDYDDGKDLSTFGAPNRWGLQDLYYLRNVIAQPSTLTLLSPQAPQTLAGGKYHNIQWTNTGTIQTVNIEFSTDNGSNWFPVYPPNQANSGSYYWLVPDISSDYCLVRVINAANHLVYDTSNAPFAIRTCDLIADLSGDCKVNFDDLAVLADSWLSD